VGNYFVRIIIASALAWVKFYRAEPRVLSLNITILVVFVHDIAVAAVIVVAVVAVVKLRWKPRAGPLTSV
jgi:hypothetical protein